MSRTNSPGSPADQPHLVTLVLHSEKALERGRELCSSARERSVGSAKVAVDVLALDAKVRWMTDAVLEQLKVRVCYRRLNCASCPTLFQLAANVAKIIEQKRSILEAQAKVKSAISSCDPCLLFPRNGTPCASSA